RIIDTVLQKSEVQRFIPKSVDLKGRIEVLDGGFRGSKIVHAKPRRNGEDGKERHPYPGRISQMQLSPIGMFDALA
ncbi:hypothetical protein Q604_UNBC11437G0001, partial [human gut metagenome]